MRESSSFFSLRRAVALALFGMAAFSSAASADLSGRAVAIDGDTIEIGDARVRLEGIDAPEAGQSCGRKWVGTWDCGRAALRALNGLIDNQTVTCKSQGRDKYGRVLGLCSAGGKDINAEMVRAGNAWAFVKYSRTYVGAEEEARAARAGIWQGDAEPAWVYREKKWAGAEQVAPDGCAIKGNVTANGHIYHMPWSPWYARVKVDVELGERWFCSEAEAQKAGWRPVGTL